MQDNRIFWLYCVIVQYKLNLLKTLLLISVCVGICIKLKTGTECEFYQALSENKAKGRHFQQKVILEYFLLVFFIWLFEIFSKPVLRRKYLTFGKVMSEL